MKKLVSFMTVFTMLFNLMSPALAASASTYKVTVSKGSGGIVTGAGTYEPGEEVIVSAEVKQGYEFTGWSNVKGVEIDDLDEEEISFIMPANKVSLKAVFKKVPGYKVTISKGSGGTVTGAGTYKAGDEVVITAEPKSGYLFSNWDKVKGIELEDATEPEITFNMPKEKVSLKAIFVKNENKVTVKKGGSGTVTGAGTYDKGEIVTLVAEPKKGFEFTGWTDIKGIEVKNVQESTLQFEMPLGPVSIKANFAKAPTYKVTVKKSGSGAVTGAGSYKAGEEVSLTGTPKSGYAFGYWVDIEGVEIENAGESSIKFVMPANKVNMKALFVKTVNKVAVKKVGSGTITGIGSYNVGDPVVLTAEAKKGYSFTGWSDAAGIEIVNPKSEILEFEMPLSPVNVTANFEKTVVGDVDGDGKITAVDRTTLARYLNGWEGYEKQLIKDNCDIFVDSKIDEMDRIVLAVYLANCKIEYPHKCGEYIVEYTNVDDTNHTAIYTCKCGAISNEVTNEHVFTDGNCECGEEELVELEYIELETIKIEAPAIVGTPGPSGLDTDVTIEIEAPAIVGTPGPSGLDTDVTIKINVGTYNPNNMLSANLYQNGKFITGAMYVTQVNPVYSSVITVSGYEENSFKIPVQKTGIYDLVITKDGHVSYTREKIYAWYNDVDLGTIYLPVGDINGDGFINSDDEEILLSENASEYENADLNGDGVIDNNDYEILKDPDNFNKSDILITW